MCDFFSKKRKEIKLIDSDEISEIKSSQSTLIIDKKFEKKQGGQSNILKMARSIGSTKLIVLNSTNDGSYDLKKEMGFEDWNYNACVEHWGTKWEVNISHLDHNLDGDKIIINAEKVDANRTEMEKLHLVMEGILGLCLIFALGLHLAPVGIIGLFLMVFLTAFKGITEEHQLGGAFEESLPFTALLVIFFVVVAVINDQSLFTPVINVVLASSLDMQVPLFYLANGALSVISDNVFVATVYMNEIVLALENNVITKEQFDRLAVAINTGTNLPSVATPNGQAAFLFLLTSSLAPLIGLSYIKMVYKALPYTIVLTLVGLACVIYFI